jgi:alkylation response protein AidB-like acyl-CoA dehydrogenase
MPVAAADVVQDAGAIAARWRTDRAERQARRQLDEADFAVLREAGVFSLGVPVDAGGLWHSAPMSARVLCDVHRSLAAADPSVTLVSAMHPSVLAFWVASPDPSQSGWEEQRRAVFASAIAGEQWATITSEPGSGGDLARTRATAAPAECEQFLPGGTYQVSGDKHFGSGLGVAHRMVTTAVPVGETEPTIFVMDVRDRPWDGAAGLMLIAPWDGMGMAATQSHAMRLERVPAVRMAWSGGLTALARAAGPLIATVFTAVVLGVVDEAISVAREQVRSKADQLRSYEQVEWSRAELDHWLAVQAYDGALRAIEGGDPRVAYRAGLRAKEAVAELAEQALLRITRVLGGGTYSRRSPFSHWFEDVRALGFLRPPWGLAYDTLFATSIE